MPSKPPAPVYVLGVGLTKFIKPQGKVDYTELGFEAGIKALLDARINYDDVDHGVACYCYGDSTCGQRVFYQFGMTGIPIYNVNNNCSTGSTGLHLARTVIGHGGADCVMVVGFEKMFPGSLRGFFEDRENPTATTAEMMRDTRGLTDAPGAAQMFGNAGREYMERYGAEPSDFAEIARVNHLHSARNPYAQFRQTYSLAEIEAAPMIHRPLTKLQCCPTSDGGAAAILVSQAFLDARPGLARDRAIRIAGQCLATDAPALFSRSAIDLVGFEMSRRAAATAMAEAQVSPRDVDVVELHDCFSANELITLDALGLCEGPGRAHELVRNGDLTHGGRYLVNPSGGLISKGHPLGASGIAQCAELVWHLRGWANNRLFRRRRSSSSSSSSSDGDDDGATTVALQHNLGLGGAVVVTVYKTLEGQPARERSDDEVGRISGVGYNPATVAKGFTTDQVRSVRSRTAASDWAEAGVGVKVQARF